MTTTHNQEQVGKIVAMAKNGIGGEKDAAVRILKKLCIKHKLDFDEMMSENEAQADCWFPYKRGYTGVIRQILWRYAAADSDAKIYRQGQPPTSYKMRTTKQRYVETLNALDVLLPLYRKERKKAQKAFFYGFLEKHWLFSEIKTDADKKQRRVSKEERMARQAGSVLAGNMEDAEIRKRLT